MKVTVEYAAQVKRAAGVGAEEIEVADPCNVQQLVSKVVERHGDGLRSILLDPEGKLHRSILVFVGETQARWDEDVSLKDRDVVTILSPISGG